MKKQDTPDFIEFGGRFGVVETLHWRDECLIWHCCRIDELTDEEIAEIERTYMHSRQILRNGLLQIGMVYRPIP